MSKERGLFGCSCGLPARKLEEPAYDCVPWIGETCNTFSNLPFVVIGIASLGEVSKFQCFATSPDTKFYCDRLWWLYLLYTMAGICSGIHHACAHIPGNRWSIWLDWTPILLSGAVLVDSGMLRLVFHVASPVSWAMLVLAIAVLLIDHIWTPLPVPVGHSLWHVLAAISIAAIYGDLQNHLQSPL
jgi:hypothetical protein